MNARARLTFTLGLLVLSCACGGGSAPKEIPQAEACPEATKAICAKVFSCDDPTINLAKDFVLGGSQANCMATLQQPPYCDSFSCQAGQTYHGDKAGQCRSEFSEVTCTELSAAIRAAGASGNIPALAGMLAPSCAQVCTAGTTDGGADR